MENDKKGKMSARPPVSKGAEDFILSATTNIIQDPIEKGRVKKNYPWEEPHVRSDVIKSFNMRLPEDFYLKLKFISEYERRSLHNICYDSVEDYVNAKLKEILR